MNRRLPSMTSLQCFEACARLQNVTRAGEELHLTQSAVSRQIRHLEDWFGCALFERNNQGLELTPAGADYAKNIQLALQQLEQAVTPPAPRARGLKVAGEYSLISHWLFPRLPEFRQDHPRARIELVTDLGQIYGSRPEFDVAFIYGDGEWQSLNSEFLITETFAAVCVPEFLEGSAPVARYEEIAAFDLLHTNDLSPAEEWLKHCGLEVDFTPGRQGQRFETFHLLLQAALQGWGVAVLPYYIVRRDLERGRLVRACDKMLTCRGYHLAVPDGKKGNPLIDDFVAWIRRTVAPEMREYERSIPS